MVPASRQSLFRLPVFMAIVEVVAASSSDIKCSSKGCVMGVIAAVILGTALVGGVLALAYHYCRSRWGSRPDGQVESEV